MQPGNPMAISNNMDHADASGRVCGQQFPFFLQVSNIQVWGAAQNRDRGLTVWRSVFFCRFHSVRRVPIRFRPAPAFFSKHVPLVLVEMRARSFVYITYHTLALRLGGCKREGCRENPVHARHAPRAEIPMEKKKLSLK